MMNTFVNITAVSLVILAPLHSQSAIPQDHVSSVVLIEIDSRTPASGFFLRDSANIYLVTAKHVLFNERTHLWRPSARLIAAPRDPKESGHIQISLDLTLLLSAGKLSFHPDRDVSVIWLGIHDLAAGDFVLFPGVRTDRASKSGVTTLTTDMLVSFQDVLVGNDAYLLGFPSSVGIAEAQQFDYYRPLLRKGAIAGKFDSLRTVILDCPVYYGNSGCPVFQVIRLPFEMQFRLVGIAVQWIPFDESYANKMTVHRRALLTNSGYSVVESADYILDLLKK